MQPSQSRPRRVIITAADSNTINAAIKSFAGQPFSWIWIGEGISENTSLKSRGTEVEIRSEVNHLSYQLHDEYVKYLGRVSAVQKGDWWRSAISEKNPYISTAFFSACCVKACLTVFEPNTNYLIITPDSALREALKVNLTIARCDVRILQPRGFPLRRAVSELTQLVAHQVYFILKNAMRVGTARYRYGLHRTPPIESIRKAGTPVSVTHIWVDRRAYSASTGQFKDVDFSKVSDVLRAGGKTVVGLANIQNAASYSKVTAYIHSANSPFLVLHAFLRFRDVLAAAWQSLLNVPSRQIFPDFVGLQVSNLLNDDLRREWLTSRDSSHILLERWVKRLKESGLCLERFIYTFENHTWERVLCKALKTAYPNIRLMGYQPNGLPLMMMNYFIAEEEARSIPLPDRIITNGEYSSRVLSAFGFNSHRVITGGGLRQEYLQARLYGNAAPKPRLSNSGRILVTPSIGRDRSIELVRKTVEAFKDAPDLNVTIKFHPAIRLEQMQVHLNRIAMPKNIRLSTQPMLELLPDADLLIYNDGTFPAVEALTFGIPVVFVQPDYGLSLDSLDGFPEARHVARTAQDLIGVVRKALQLPPTEQGLLERLGIVRQLVGEVTEETLKLFAE